MIMSASYAWVQLRLRFFLIKSWTRIATKINTVLCGRKLTPNKLARLDRKTLIEATDFKPQSSGTLNEPGAVLSGYTVAGTTYLSQ